MELARAEDIVVRVFLRGGAVGLAVADVAGGSGNDGGGAVSRLVSAGIDVAVTESDLAVRDPDRDALVIGAQPASGVTLAAWTIGADRVLVF